MAEQKSISIYDILTKIGELAGISPTTLNLDDTLEDHLGPMDVAELLAYLATYLGYDADRLRDAITEKHTIEDLYEWFRAEQDAAGVPDGPFTAAGFYKKNKPEDCYTAHETLIRPYRNKWHIRESAKILETVKSSREEALKELRAKYAQDKKGCTGSAVVLTLILMIPAAIFLGNLARKIVLGLLLLHLFATVVFKIWGLNGADCKKREAEIAKAEQAVRDTEAELENLQAVIQALS